MMDFAHETQYAREEVASMRGCGIKNGATKPSLLLLILRIGVLRTPL